MFGQENTKALLLFSVIMYLLLIWVAPANSEFHSVNVYDIRGIFIDAVKVSNPVDEIQIRAIQPATYITANGDEISLAAGVYYFAPNSHDIVAQNTVLNEFGFLDVTNAFLPLEEWEAGDVETADLNEDGLLDIVFSLHSSSYDGYSDYRPRVWIQAPQGNFVDETELRIPATSTPCYDIELFDANSDGHVDIITTGYLSGVYYISSALFINDGTGHFTDESTARLPQYTDDSWAYFFEPADVDNNQSMDLIVNLWHSSFGTDSLIVYPVIWMNNGNGYFSEDTLNRIPYQDGHYGFSELAVSDIDGDSLIDIIFANMEMIWMDPQGNPYDTLSGQNACFRNTGNGFFVDETEERMPVQDSRYTRDLAICDIDNDGEKDILEVGFYQVGQYNQQVRLLINDGEGNFDVSLNSLPESLEGWFNDSEFGLLNDDQSADLFMIAVLPGEVSYSGTIISPLTGPKKIEPSSWQLFYIAT